MLLSLLNSSSIFSNESTLGFVNIGGIELSYTCISTHIQTHALTHVKLNIHMENAIWLFSEQCTLQIIIPTRYVCSLSCPTDFNNSSWGRKREVLYTLLLSFRAQNVKHKTNCDLVWSKIGVLAKISCTFFLGIANEARSLRMSFCLSKHFQTASMHTYLKWYIS